MSTPPPPGQRPGRGRAEVPAFAPASVRFARTPEPSRRGRGTSSSSAGGSRAGSAASGGSTASQRGVVHQPHRALYRTQDSILAFPNDRIPFGQWCKWYLLEDGAPPIIGPDILVSGVNFTPSPALSRYPNLLRTAAQRAWLLSGCRLQDHRGKQPTQFETKEYERVLSECGFRTSMPSRGAAGALPTATAAPSFQEMLSARGGSGTGTGAGIGTVTSASSASASALAASGSGIPSTAGAGRAVLMRAGTRTRDDDDVRALPSAASAVCAVCAERAALGGSEVEYCRDCRPAAVGGAEGERGCRECEARKVAGDGEYEPCDDCRGTHAGPGAHRADAGDGSSASGVVVVPGDAAADAAAAGAGAAGNHAGAHRRVAVVGGAEGERGCRECEARKAAGDGEYEPCDDCRGTHAAGPGTHRAQDSRVTPAGLLASQKYQK